METKTNKIQYFLSLGIRDSFNILLGLSSKEAKMNKTNKVIIGEKFFCRQIVIYRKPKRIN